MKFPEIECSCGKRGVLQKAWFKKAACISDVSHKGAILTFEDLLWIIWLAVIEGSITVKIRLKEYTILFFKYGIEILLRVIVFNSPAELKVLEHNEKLIRWSLR